MSEIAISTMEFVQYCVGRPSNTVEAQYCGGGGTMEDICYCGVIPSDPYIRGYHQYCRGDTVSVVEDV